MYSQIPCPSAQREGKGWRLLYIPQMRVWNRVLPCTYAPRLKMEVTWPELAYHMLLNFEPAFSCSRTHCHWKVFERKILATSNEKVGMYREKSALEELIVSSICCWRLRLLRRFFRSDQLLSIFVDSELQRTFSRATWLHLELRRSSHWNLDLDLHPCSNQNRYAFPLIARFEKLFFLSTLAHHFVSIRQSKRQSRQF